MTLQIFGLMLFGAVLAGQSASAQQMNADDLKWVNACIVDNKGGASDAVIRKYCICMNEKMSDNETRSITQWEKTHVTEQRACSRAAGWK